MSIDDSVTTTEKVKSDALDWDELRRRSLQPGGFGASRAEIWPQLLAVPPHVTRPTADGDSDTNHEEPAAPYKPHDDERQIHLDTERSFVLYPVGINRDSDREKLQAGLHDLLVSLFRKRPNLSYFQGYHDIVTVLFLTLPPEIQLACVEKLSLHRLRDSMGSSLEPVLGLMRITKNLIQDVDPEYSEMLQKSSPLPFYALSNLLTLFAHDMPTLALIQHVFDYLLCRPPIIVVYLATAIILSRKQEAERLAEEGEEGMIHSLLSGLPDITDEVVDDQYEPLREEEDVKKEEEIVDVMSQDASGEVKLEENEVKIEGNTGNVVQNEKEREPEAEGSEINVKVEDVIPEPFEDAIGVNDTSGLVDQPPNISSMKLESSTETDTKEGVNAQTSSSSVRSPTPEPPPPPRVKITLSALLAQSDALYALYPPSHPSLSLSSIMGPQSVIFTWSENPSLLPDDDEAEKMVTRPELIVYPYIEEDQEIESGKEEETSPEGRGKKGKDKRKRRKLRKSRFGGKVEKRTMVVGTVLVLGVAMAVYGMKVRGGTGGVYHAFGDPHNSHRELKRVGAWMSGVLAGVGGKLLGGFNS